MCLTLSEIKDEDESEALNLMAGQQLQSIRHLKKQNIVTPYDANLLVAKVTDELTAFKVKMEKERERQEAELHKNLSAAKKQRLDEQRKAQEKEVAEYDRRNQEQQTDVATDPLTYVTTRQQLLSDMRADHNDREDEIDKGHVDQLEALRDKLSEETREELGQYELRLMDELKQRGLLASKADKIMKQHKRELAGLRERQDEERERQKKLFVEKLEKNRENLENQKRQEKLEQQMLREHERELVKNLINGQMSLSETERDRIMKEHEKQMVKLENSLTLNKLQQKRRLEEKLMEKRSQQMDKLRVKQLKELKTAQADSEADIRDSELDLIKSHSEQKLALIHGDRFDVDDELDGIRIEMTKDRAMALKSQEERLGGMLAGLQMDKAREIAQIEEQQKAIHSLKVNMMDDLTERGVLSDPECAAIIDQHKQQQVNLKSKLDAQRAKQEKALRERLQSRIEMKEQQINQSHEAEIHEIAQSTKNKTATKIKKVILIQKQILELEHFRNQMDREVSQTLEELRRQFELRKLSALQEQELQFVSGLVRLGKFRHSELVSVLDLLYPGKSHEQINEQLAKIYNTDLKLSKEDEAKMLSESSGSRLAEKIRASTLETAANSRPSSTTGSRTITPRPASFKKKKRKPKKVYDMDDLPSLPTSLDERPEPLGQDQADGYTEVVDATPLYTKRTSIHHGDTPPQRQSRPSIHQASIPPQGRMTPIDIVPSSHLPPMEQPRKKKKKKGGLKKMAQIHALDDSFDE